LEPDTQEVWTPKDEEYGWNSYGGNCLSFECEVANKSVWLYAEEYGDPDQVGSFVQEFLKTFRPDQEFTITWAYTCSKPRVGGFGGGAAIITADAFVCYDAMAAVREIQKLTK